MPWRRLDLEAIAAELHRLPDAVASGDVSGGGEEPPTAAMIRRLMLGYAYVDELLAGRVDIFAYGASRHILELNHRVLCGVSPARRSEFRDHIEATEAWFYDRPGAGIAAFSDWMRRQEGRAPLPLAAGTMFQIVSTPQLFIEGNRRTSMLVASYVLARGGLPPLVAGPEIFPAYDALSARAVAIDRAGIADALAAWLVVHRLTGFLRDSADPRFLAPPVAPPVAAPSHPESAQSGPPASG